MQYRAALRDLFERYGKQSSLEFYVVNFETCVHFSQKYVFIESTQKTVSELKQLCPLLTDVNDCLILKDVRNS